MTINCFQICWRCAFLLSAALTFAACSSSSTFSPGTGGTTGTGGSSGGATASGGQKGTGGTTGTGGQTGGTTTTGTPPSDPSARVVGAYGQIGTTCSSGSYRTGFVAFLCPGGRIRAAGYFGGTSVVELMCGSYTTTPASMSNCSDNLACFAQVNATVKDTLTQGGVSDVRSNDPVFMLLNKQEQNSYGTGTDALCMFTPCNDKSSGYAILTRVSANMTTDDCVSSTCNAPSSSSGSGTCGTDCDCGQCWYCESGTCMYGGEGPYGCYRGCTW